MKTCSLLLAFVLFLLPTSASAMDHVSLKRDGKPLHVSGKILIEAVDGGLLLKTADGTLWAIQPAEIVSRKTDAIPFKTLGQKKLAGKLLKEMGPGFKIHTTAHYVICYNTSPAYAKWCGSLYERLHAGFNNYWTKQGFKLHEPELPLAALVFADKESYTQYARHELGDAADSIVAYFSLRTNRVTMYDLTGVERGGGKKRGGTSKRINQILSRPEAARMVATIVHEATHQLAFNCGLQTRYADIPLWISEGIAVYFESPDLKNSRGWKGIGKIHRQRLLSFRKYLRNRPADSLQTLMKDDKRFRNLATMSETYSEAWALNYYLIHKRKGDYIKYMQFLSAKKPIHPDSPQERLDQFKAVFGNDMEKIDADFIRYMKSLRR